jgi:hypothetical protein
MNDEELRQQLDDIRRLADRALGEATIATLLIPPLLDVLVNRGVLPDEGVAALIEESIRVLDADERSASDLLRPALRLARTRLQGVLSERASTPPKPPTGRKRRSPRP